MRIAIDIQGVQSDGSRTRGIGRYSLAIVKTLINNFPEHEYFLVANASLNDSKLDFKDELKKNNVNYHQWYSPCPLDFISNNNINYQIGVYLRTYAFSLLNPDIVLMTSFFEGFKDNCLTDLDKNLLSAPVTSIFYDLIPLINSNLYLDNNPDFSKFYKSKLQKVQRLDALLAISKSSSKELIDHLKIIPKNVFNISSACDRNVFKQEASKEYNNFKNLHNLKPFILYSGASDPRKNVRRLLEAFSELSLQLKNVNLVLVGKLLPQEIELINTWISLFSINPERVFKLGYIPDDELVFLYQNCDLFVFPSLHEGFGLPVLEAMCCGAPVIGSNRTSIPEIISYEPALFDPNNLLELTNLMIKGLTDQQFRSELVLNSSRQSKKFSWSKTASLIMECFILISKNKNLLDISNWNMYVEFRESQLSQMLACINNNKNLSLKLNDSILSLISASIDKINISADQIYRFRLSLNNYLTWQMEGPFDSSYSLSILNQYLSRSIQQHVSKLTIKITEGNGNYPPNIKYLESHPDIYELYKSSESSNIIPDIVSRNLYPPRVYDLDSRINLLHGYGWEESEFPFEWIRNFNYYLQGITVMSQKVKKILIDNGLEIPVEVCGLGLDHLHKFKPDNQFKLPTKSFCFLHISSCFPRKGVDVLLKSYGEAFRSSDDVSLIIKTFSNPHNDVNSMLADFRANDQSYPDVIVINSDLNERQIKSLYLQSNVLVIPSRGEGFGLPIGEAMALGLPVITTGWGGQTDFCNTKNSWLLNYDYVPADSHFNLGLSYWAEPSTQHLTALMKEVYSCTQEELDERTNLAKESIKDFTWDNVAKENIQFVNNLCSANLNQYTKIGWVSTWNQRCGIASYSRHLLDYVFDDFIVFNPLNEPKNESKDFNVIPSWNLDDNLLDDFSTLYEQIINSNISTLVIQFNYGFFDFISLSDLISKIHSKGIVIIMFMHSTIDPIHNNNKKLKLICSSLRKCDRLLVHSIDDLNRLKEINLVDNVSLFPHGILDYDNGPQINSNNKNKSIVSYGFCLPNKGYFELIKAIDILKKKNILVELTIYSSIYSDNYFWVYEKLTQLVEKLDLNDLITINKDYLPDDQILQLLSMHDFSIFPYQESNESSSAAVRHGLATGLPVIVSPLSIFNDVSNLVEYLPGTSPDLIAEGILDWYNRNPKYEKNINLKRLESINCRRFSNLGLRLSSMIRGLQLSKSLVF